jgi:YVTN family beta-propeller protein
MHLSTFPATWRLLRAICICSLLLSMSVLEGCGGASSPSATTSPSQASTPTPTSTPTISALSPSSAQVGSPALALTVAGTKFVPSSMVTWNGVSLTSTVNTTTQITATVPANLLAATGIATVQVIDPSPISLQSNSLSFNVTVPVPTITSVSPATAVVGSGDTSITLTGQNYVSGSVVLAGTTQLTTTFVSSTSLLATLPSSLLAQIATLSLTVSNPAPQAATSQAFSFSVTAAPTPSISTLTPSNTTEGAPSFDMTITGQSLAQGAVVQFNGATLTPFTQTSTMLTVTVPANLVAAVGTYPVEVVAPGNGSSGPVTTNSLNFSVNLLPAGEFIVNQVANDIAADPVRPLLYASVPSTASANGNSVVVIDPTTGAITKSVSVGSEPNHLAVSSDGQYLYVSLDGASQVERYILPALTLDFTVSLGADPFFGPNVALDVGVAPGSPHVWAVSSGNPGVSPEAQDGVQIYDDATPRGARVGRSSPHGGFDLLLGTIVWGKDSSTLYGANNESTGFDLYVLPITTSGIGTIVDYGSAMPGFNNAHIHYESTTGLVYGDNGNVVDPSNGQAAGVFSYSGPMTTDGALNAAFFVNTPVVSNALILASFDLIHYTPLNTFNVPNVTGAPVRLVRWGVNGLAFNAITNNYTGSGINSKTGQIYIYAGTFVKQ